MDKKIDWNTMDKKIDWNTMDKDLFVRSLRLYLYRTKQTIDAELKLVVNSNKKNDLQYLAGKSIAYGKVLEWIENVDTRHEKVEWEGA